MQLSDEAIDTFISDKITKITTCGAADVGAEFPARDDWLKGYALTAIFNGSYRHEVRGLGLLIVRRVRSAIDAYDAGRIQLSRVADRARNRWLHYLDAVTHFETALSQLYQAYQAILKHGGAIKPAFKPNDGSDVQRLNTIYNSFRHDPVGEDYTLWLTNTGFECTQTGLTFGEFEAMLRTWGLLARAIAEGDKHAFAGPPPA